MSSQPFLYRNIQPPDRERHRGLRVPQQGRTFTFAGEAHLIPAVIDEFAIAAREMPIVFVQDVNRPACVFVTGPRPNTSAFVGRDGAWTGAYVPAYLRRYPFILGEVPGQEPILCVDDGAQPASDSGERLFTEAGEPTDALAAVAGLVRGYADAARRTEAFVDRLMKLKLLRGATLDAVSPAGSTAVIHGLAVVDEERLKGLDGRSLEGLHKEGLLGAIYAHLISLNAMASLSARDPSASAPVMPAA